MTHRSDLARRGLLLVMGLLAFQASAVSAQEKGFLGQFRDPEDGQFDMSAWLAEAHGFLPIVSLITEPAVDYGVVAALAFFHRPADWTLEEARAAMDRGDHQSPPSISAAAGGYTLNDSWFVGGGHLGVWRQDRLRYTGFGGYGSFNLELAGVTPGDREVTFRYNLEGWMLMQSLKWRLPDTYWWIGATGDLVGMVSRFEADRLPDLPIFTRESRNGSLGAVLAYDSRDNVFTPNQGVSATLDLKRHDTAFLGDYDYWETKLTATSFVRMGSAWVLGLRGQTVGVGDDAPFWALPGVQMRGIPARRYVGQNQAQAEAELRWDWTPRWSLLGFGGWGWTESTIRETTTSRSVQAAGGGFRYLIARAFGLRAGVDLAYGEDGAAFYVTMGSAWY